MGFLNKVREVVDSLLGRDDEAERPEGERPGAERREAERPEAVRDAAAASGADGSTGPVPEDFAPADPTSGEDGAAPSAASDSVPGGSVRGDSASSGSAATPVGSQDPVRHRTVTVQRGDTLSSLAERHGADWRTMAELNGIPDPELIYPGQVFKLPPA